MFDSLNQGSKAVEQMNKKLNLDQFEELKDRLEEQMADVDERQ